ncbi:hypothetical protein [Parasphingorhabdus sp.]|uniref:hypothetical protein n=1 Tax=Parasphingorhabdus sp. TaxID=2709688 RepID=UPI003A919EB7
MTGSRLERLRSFAQASDKPVEIVADDADATTEIPNEEENEMTDETKNTEPKADAATVAASAAAPKADENPAQPVAADGAAIRAEERARVAAVFASDDVKGREQAAAHLLSSSDMPADGIVAILPKLAPSADSGASAGQQMLDAMAQDGDVDTGIDAGAPKPAANHGWDDIHAEIRESRKL